MDVLLTETIHGCAGGFMVSTWMQGYARLHGCSCAEIPQRTRILYRNNIESLWSGLLSFPKHVGTK